VYFAFSKTVFLILFIVIGVASVGVAFFFYLVVRFTTHLSRPPMMRFWGYFSLIAPPAITGTVLGLIPGTLVGFAVFYLLRGYDLRGGYPKVGYWILDSYVPNWTDNNLDPNLVNEARQGRFGAAFLIMGVLSIFAGVKLFVPPRESKRETEMMKKRTKDASKEDIWNPLLWRRNNLLMSSAIMTAFCVCLVEFSLWGGFGDYIWTIILTLKLVVDTVVDLVLTDQLREELLKAPLLAIYGITQGIMTLAASDFLDFLFSYLVGFGFLFVSRMYMGPYTERFIDIVRFVVAVVVDKAMTYIPSWLGKKKPAPKVEQGADPNAPAEGRKRAVLGMNKDVETVEPIIGYLAGYTADTFILVYTPIVILLLIIFRTETGMPELYTIRKQDMEFYLLFALTSIFFQLCADIYIHGAMENFHGWKVYDYLVYTRYRFLQRETRWKGMEDTLDECIEDGMRTIDQMCFSSQYYMMLALYTNGLTFMVLGLEMQLRGKYNMWADPVFMVILSFVCGVAYVAEKLLLWLALQVRGRAAGSGHEAQYNPTRPHRWFSSLTERVVTVSTHLHIVSWSCSSACGRSSTSPLPGSCRFRRRTTSSCPTWMT
jgi:hypothetical protein